MTWEWIGTAAVGTAGIVFTWVTGKQARDAARAVDRDGRAKQLLERSYTDVVAMAERVTLWTLVMPVVETGMKLPALPSYQERSNVEALVRAFGSPQVRERMVKWRAAVKEVESEVALIQLVEEHLEKRSGLKEEPRQCSKI